MKLSIDYETRSEDDLTQNGLYHYANHPSTKVYMMAYQFDEEPIQIWVNDGTKFPQEVLEHFKANKPVWAFNVAFERLITNKVLDIPLSIEQCFCTAAMGRVNGLPNSLAKQALALGSNISKGIEGKSLIQKYSVTNTPWEDIPKDDQDKFKNYCIDDVKVERVVALCCQDLSPAEWEDFHNVERMNDRGIKVDIEFAQAAIKLASSVRKDVKIKLTALTGGKVKSITERKQRDLWLLPRLTEEQLAVITPKGNLSFDKTRRGLLSTFPDLDDKVRRYLELSEEAGGSTLSKYDAMIRSNIDGRIYGAFMFNAATTGRASSKLVQLQNLKRPIFDDEEAERLIEDVINGVDIEEPASTLAYLVRPTIFLEEGMTTYDYSSVEYIVLSYLANNKKAMTDYKNDVDAYKVLGSEIFNCPIDKVTKDQRQASKIVILAAGFGGGKRAVQSMAVNYGGKISDVEAQELITNYRNLHPREVDLWHSTRQAIKDAVEMPNVEFSVARNKIKYESDGKDLWCQLPSGRFLRYMDAKIELVKMPWGKTEKVVRYKNTKIAPAVRQEWPRATLSHIVAVENFVQAFANDLLRDALAVCEDEQLEPFMMVHDEISVPGDHRELMKEIMETPPVWCKDMPLKAEGKFSYCFGK